MEGIVDFDSVGYCEGDVVVVFAVEDDGRIVSSGDSMGGIDIEGCILATVGMGVMPGVLGILGGVGGRDGRGPGTAGAGG